ncbi:MAG: hypothetical protein JW941_10330 [Candidatus Coatesbacteria bacterium]|nr:hypothetical protein [Candidatus Coatesbacteria bacterium]
MTRDDLKRSISVGAFGQVGGLLGGFMSVILASVFSPRNFFDSPIRVIVFTTACAMIGGIAAFSASTAITLSARLIFSIPIALLMSICFCSVLKLLLYAAGQDSPIGKLFLLVSAIVAVVQVPIVCMARMLGTDSAGRNMKPKPISVMVIGAGLITSLALAVVLLTDYLLAPIIDITEVGLMGISLYLVVGFFVGISVSFSEYRAH